MLKRILPLLLLLIVAPFVQGQTTLNNVTAATAGATINNGNNLIQWNWDLTGSAAAYAFSIGENTASSVTGNPVGLMQVQTITGSTLIPFNVTQSLNGSLVLPAVSITPTWNTSGNVLGAIFMNVQDTASGTNSLLVNIQHNTATAFTVDKNGNSVSAGTGFANNFSNTQTPTTVNCSTSGSVKFAQPQQGTSDKRVKAYAAACVGTASFTFPTAFSFTPAIVTTNGPAASVVTSLSTTAMTVTGSTTTGFLVLEGW